MKKFSPKEKLGKKARKQLDSEQRTTWAFSPVTKKVESKKLYNRKRKPSARYDDFGRGFCYVCVWKVCVERVHFFAMWTRCSTILLPSLDVNRMPVAM